MATDKVGDGNGFFGFLGALMFPHAPGSKKRRELWRLKKSLKRAKILKGSGERISGPWVRNLWELKHHLEFFVPTVLRSVSSDQIAVRQATARRFWEESLGAGFIKERYELTLETMTQRFVESNVDFTQRTATEKRINDLIDSTGVYDTVTISRMWNALWWFSSLCVFSFDEILKPWAKGGGRHPDFSRSEEGSQLLPEIKLLYRILSALEPGQNLENALKMLWNMLGASEKEVQVIPKHLKHIQAILENACTPESLCNLVCYLEHDPAYVPEEGKRETQWYANQRKDFSVKLKTDMEKAWASAVKTWLDNNLKNLFENATLLPFNGYGDAENEMLAQRGFPTLSLVKPAAIFKTFLLVQLRNEILPYLRPMLLNARFIDQNFNQNMTNWIYAADALMDDIAVFESKLTAHFSSMIQSQSEDVPDPSGKVKSRSLPVTTIESMNKWMAEYLQTKSQELLKLLELITLLEADAQASRHVIIGNWPALEGYRSNPELQVKAARHARVFFAIMRAYFPLKSGVFTGS